MKATMSSTVSDFTEAEQKLVTNVLLQRYGRLVALQLADSELQLDPGHDELTLCPTLYWSEQGAQFVVCKTGDGIYRCQFFYSEAEQFGTGRDEYRDLDECVMTLLQVQSDHARQQAGLFSGATAENLAEDEYHGPTII
jgi:hypothetical protein